MSLDIMTPKGGDMSYDVRVDVHRLRDEFHELTKEVRALTESIIQFRTQDVFSKVTRLEEKEIEPLKERLTKVETFQVKITTAITVLTVITTIAQVGLAFYVAFKK